MHKTSFSPLLLAETITSLLILAGITPLVLYRENFSFSLLWARFHNLLLLFAILLSNLLHAENTLTSSHNLQTDFTLLQLLVEISFPVLFANDSSFSLLISAINSYFHPFSLQTSIQISSICRILNLPATAASGVHYLECNILISIS